MLEGAYVMHLGEHEVRCSAGSFVFIPAGMRRGFRVGAVQSRKLSFSFPAATVGYLGELSAAIRWEEADESVLDRIARRRAMEIVGPVPQGHV